MFKKRPKAKEVLLTLQNSEDTEAEMFMTLLVSPSAVDLTTAFKWV